QVGMRALADWRCDPYWQGIVRIMETAERHGIRAAFYMKTSDAGPRDTGYVLADVPAMSMLREIEARGHEIGFHPGYETYLQPEVLQREKLRLDAVAVKPVSGGRQHY